MSGWANKKFWKVAEVGETDGGYEVLLDGRKLRTPAKSEFVVPSREIAQQIAQEWHIQEDVVDPDSMPVTRMANSAIDKVAPQFDAVATMIAAYGETDLLCYRAESPKELVAHQEDVWGAYLDWAKQEFDAPLVLGAGVMHVAQPSQSVANLRARVFALNAFELAAFHDLVAISGSLVLGLAAIAKKSPPEDLWQASRLDEIWQEKQWGEDEEATAFAKTKLQGFLDAYNFYHSLTQ